MTLARIPLCGSVPLTRLWDLAYAAQAFALSGGERDPERTTAMLALFEGAQATGDEPWASMYANGHGDHWARVLAFVWVVSRARREHIPEYRFPALIWGFECRWSLVH